MLSPSLREMIKGRIREFWREPSASFFVILVPLMWLIIFGVAFSGDQKKKFGIGLIEAEEASNPSMVEAFETVKSSLSSHEQVKLYLGNSEDIDLLFMRGKVILSIAPTASSQLAYNFDPANPESQGAKLLVDHIIQSKAGRQDPVAITDSHRDQPGTRYIDFFIPGLLALSIMTSSLFGTGMTIVAFRRNKLFKRFCTTPINTFELIISFIVGRFFILIVEFAVILLAGYLFFDFSLQGNFLTFVLASVLGASCFTAIGILSGAKLDNVGTYNGIVNLLTLPMMILSGVFFSRSNFPEWFDKYLDYLPLTPLVDSLRQIALEGAGLMDITMQFTVMLVYTVVAVVVTKPLFRWY